jgi:outer membrane protein assembly factor BamB
MRPGPGDWPAFRNTPSLDGSNRVERRLNAANVAQLRQAWTAPIGPGYDYDNALGATSSPAVANGIVYVGSLDHHLYAFNATTGKQLWASGTSEDVMSSPAVGHGVVYVDSRFGGLYAFDAQNGSELWHKSIDGENYSSPVVVHGVVYVGGDRLHAFNALTGRKLWSAAPAEYGSPAVGIAGTPAVVDGVVFTSSDDGGVGAFRAKDGKRLWQADIGQGCCTTPESSPAVANGIVYVGSNDHHLYAFRASNGAELWKARTGDYVESSPAVASGVVYVGSLDDHVYAYSASTGTQLWKARTGDSVDSSPAVANGVVYIGSWDRRLYAFDAKSGRKLWSGTTGWSIESSPAISHGAVYITSASTDGKLYAYTLPRRSRSGTSG